MQNMVKSEPSIVVQHQERMAHAVAGLSRWKQQALALLSAERSVACLRGAYEGLAALTAVFEPALTFMWSAFGQKPVDVTLLRNRIEGLIIDANATSLPPAGDRLASLVAYPVAYALDGVSTEDDEAVRKNAIWATQTETDMAYFIAGGEAEAAGVRYYSDEHDRAVDAHPLLQRTMAAQEADLADLDRMTVDALRERARGFCLKST
jgi:hypothetical protein